MADNDDHAAAVEFESTYDVMFYLGNPANKIKDVGDTTNMESNSVSRSETNHSQSSHVVRKTEMQQTSSKSKITETKRTSSKQSSKLSEIKSVETKEFKMQSKSEKTEQTVAYSNGPNTDNGRVSEDRNTSPSASLSNRSSRSPRSPASPTTLSPQSPTHWSISARTSPSVSTGHSPRSTSPASPGSPVQITVTSEEIMEAYAKQEKAFQEVFLNQASPMMLKTPPRTRSPSSSPSRKSMSVGIDHLDNLVRLMEQLSSLKEENTSLRKKCAYLEDTKTLLKVQNDMLLFRKELARTSKRVNAKPVRTRSKRLQKGHQNRPPLDMRSMSIIERRGSDSSLDDLSFSMRERSGSGKLSQRSQSVGSINVHEGTVDLDIDIKSKHGKRGLRDKKRIETVFSRSTITSKWNRVKKVFSGKPEISTKTETSAVTAEQLVKANSKTSKSQKEGSIGGSSSQESADSKIRAPGGGSSTSGDAMPPSPSSPGPDIMIPSLVADNHNIYEEIVSTEHNALEAECNVVSTSRGSSFGSDESNHDTNKTTMTTTTTTTNKQHLKTSSREERSFHHSTSSPSPQYLTVESQASLRPRRQSTPNPHMTWTAEDLELIEKIELEPPRSPRIGRSSSFKATKRQNSLDVSSPGEVERARTRSPDIRKSNRTAWGRVKDIIHTRRDSLKVKNKRSNSAGDMLPDASSFEDNHLNYDSPNSSSSQPPSPKSERRGSIKPARSPRSSPPRKRNSPSAGDAPSTPAINRQDSIVIAGTPVDVSALIGGMSEEFTKKMQEWEDKKRRSIFSKESSICVDDDDKNSTKFNAEFIKKMEQWEKMKGLEQRSVSVCTSPRPRAETQSPPGGTTPTRELEGSQSQMDVLSESFSKTVQEWERIKTKRIKDGGSPLAERRGRRESRKSRKVDGRSKSRERDRSHNKYEKQKERERQKIEKKEKLLEKERLKLEKMKYKLEAVEILSEANVEGVTSEFERKLHEWEVMKGLNPSAVSAETKLKSSTSASQLNRLTVSHQRSSSAKEYKDITEISHHRSNSAKDHKEQMALQRRSERERAVSEGHDLSLHVPVSSADFSPTSSAGGRSGATSPQVMDETTSIDINITAETVAKLEEHNRKLQSQLSEKDEDLAALQDDVTQLTTRINEMDIDHNHKIDHYKRELWAASSLGRYTIETDLVAAGMNEVERRLQQLHSNQRMLVAEKSQLQLQMKQLTLAKQAAESRLVQELRNMSSLKDSKEPDSSEQILKLHSDFEKLCNFFLKIQTQLGELKIGIAERNQLLLDMQRHLISKEVTNRLLEANVQRKDLELQFFQGRDNTGVLKRSRTFTGNDLIQRPEHFSGKRPKKYLPKQPSEDYEGTVREMQTVTLTEIEQAYWDWLERLRRQRAVLSGSHIPDVSTDEAQTDTKGIDMKEVGAQTVMTLCNISHASPSGSPVARLSSAPTKVSRAAAPEVQAKRSSSKHHPLITKAKALEMARSKSVSSSNDDIAKEKINGVKNESAESNVDEKDSSLTLAEPPIRPPRRARLIRWERKTSTDDSLSSLKSDDGSKPKDKAQTDRATPPTSTSSPSTPGWSSPSTPSSANMDSRVECSFTFSDEPQSKPPISPTRRKRSPGIRKAGSSSPEKLQSPTKMYSISVPYPQHDKSPNLPRAKDVSVSGESDAKSYLAKLDDALNSGHEETYAEYKLRTSCAPHSPIIRSKYQRKIKAAESKANHNGDARTWQATPPRRLIRHRKISSEKRPDISSLVEGDLSANLGRIAQHDDHDQAWRNRALSDSHPALKKDSLSVPTDDSAPGQFVFKYQKDQKQLPVSDVINRFERQSLHSSSGEVFRKSPSPGAIGRPTVSPVRRLKTAEELLAEYSKQRRSSAGNNMDRLSPGRDKFPSTSSDKENDKHEKSVIKNNSGQSTPERGKESRASPKPGTFVSQAIRKLSVTDVSDQKPPLQDMTNDSPKSGQQKQLHKAADPRLKDLPRLGIVSKQAGLFQAKIGAESRQTKRQAPSPPGADYGIKSNSSHRSSPGTESPSSPGRGKRSPEKSLYPPGAAAPTSSPQSSRAKGYSKFFARKVSPSSPTGNKGVVSALCKQAMFVDIDSAGRRGKAVSDTADQTASPERRRAKGKFLDSNWLQKPRRFFKVSKC